MNTASRLRLPLASCSQVPRRRKATPGVPSTKQVPFDLRATQLEGFDSYVDLARWICEEIQNALDVRGHIDADLDYWHRIYEQDRTRLFTNRPSPGGADLTSPLGTQYVDSLHARAMQTVFGVEPIWTVEGWADSVQKAPFVEEFHQWTAEDERLQSYVDRALQNAWIDSEGIIEVYEEIDYRPIRKTIWAQMETVPDELGQPRAVFDEKNQPQFVKDERGKYAEVEPPIEGQPIPQGIAQMEIDSYEPVRVGPGYSVIDYRDFLTLPGHAKDKRDVWGYAKRLFRRYPYLQQKAKEGIYDKEALKRIDDSNERETSLDDARMGVTVARQDGRTAEKELYEVAFLLDLDGAGERWWVATVHLGHQELLRLKYDDLGTQIGFGRFVRFVPFPRKNSVGGFSVIGHKLITLIEEHTAVRNMRADRAALATSAPLKVQQGALYDPEEQPFGVGAVIYVRDMNEVNQMEIADVPGSVNDWEQTILDATERTMGVNDVASGIQSDSNRTLGEVQMRTGASEVRINLVVKRVQEAMEDLGQIRHAIWKRVLASQGEMPMPHGIMAGIEARGVDVDQIPGGTITAQLLEGKFKFKPRGSVETADNGRLRGDFVQAIQMLPALFATNQTIAASWQTPQAARALNEQFVKLFRFPDRQAILGMPGQSAGGTQQMLQDPQVQGILQQFGGGGSPLGAGAMGPAPGTPPGAAPPPNDMGGMPPMGVQ